MNDYLNINLHILSPVHIGCDDVYEPTSFVIDESSNELIEFDSYRYINSLSEKEKKDFISICEKDNILEIYKFIKRTYKPAVGGHNVEISSGLTKHYKEVLNLNSYNKNTVINQFLINKTTYNVNNKLPYIPGSSIKGSLRTAFLSKLAIENKVYNYASTSNKLEKELLGGAFHNDPFRLLKISDFLPAENIKKKIYYAINKKKRESRFEAQGPYQIFESIQTGSIFKGRINLSRAEVGSGVNYPIKNIRDFLKEIHQQYFNQLLDENKIIKEKKFKQITSKNKNLTENLAKTTFFIRIGRHSGADAVTIKNNSKIKIMQGRNKQPIYKNTSTTMWLASDESRCNDNHNLIPFGWAILEIIE